MRIEPLGGRHIAPTVLRVVADEVFAVAPGSADGKAVGGEWTDCVLRQDCDGLRWYESLSGTTMSAWMTEGLAAPCPDRRCDIVWGDADRDAHRSGVLACLDAIAAGEVYQACVCTQFTGAPGGAPIDFFADAVTRPAPARALTSPGRGVRWRRCPPSCFSGAPASR
jgi:hypothetical protein